MVGITFNIPQLGVGWCPNALASGSCSSDTSRKDLFPVQSGFDQFHGGFRISDLDD
jgi:hypothetical protein